MSRCCMKCTTWMWRGRYFWRERWIQPSPEKLHVKNFERASKCQLIDPMPSTHEGDEIYVSNNWARLAIDIIHYWNAVHLWVVGCGPGRIAIWQGRISLQFLDCIYFFYYRKVSYC